MLGFTLKMKMGKLSYKSLREDSQSKRTAIKSHNLFEVFTKVFAVENRRSFRQYSLSFALFFLTKYFNALNGDIANSANI